MAADITGDEMYFKAISRRGPVVDAGVLTRRKINRSAPGQEMELYGIRQSCMERSQT